MKQQATVGKSLAELFDQVIDELQVVLIGQIVQADDPRSYVLSQDLYSFEPYGLMIRRNDADFRLVANRSLAQIYRTGQYRKLFERWFGRVGLKPSPVLAAMYQIEALPE